MARKASKNLTERELQIMQIVWELGEARLGDVQAALNRTGDPVAPSTVATQLGILVQKQYLTQIGRHGRYRYAATCTREQTTRRMLDDFLERLGLGGAPRFLIGLLKTEQLSDDDRAALKDILQDEPDTQSCPARPRKGRRSTGEDEPS